MPRYDFVCSICKLAGGIIIPIDEKIEAPVCAECEEPMTRIYNAPAVTFNGSGFYSTDK